MATKTKFIVVTDDDMRPSAGTQMERFCKDLHTLYVNMACNPFYSVEQEQKIESKVFTEEVKELVTTFNRHQGV